MKPVKEERGERRATICLAISHSLGRACLPQETLVLGKRRKFTKVTVVHCIVMEFLWRVLPLHKKYYGCASISD